LKLLSFDFNNNSIRTILIDDEPWFVLKDLAKALELSNHKQTLIDMKNRLKKGEVSDEVSRTYPITDSLGRTQQATIINEIGLYEISFASKKEEAIKFRFWITSEVLPSIRKTGSYSLKKEEKVEFDFEEIQKVVKIGVEFLNEFENLNPVKQIKLDNFVKQKSGESLLEDFGISFENSYFLPTEIGNMIGMSGAEINLILEKKGFQFKDENGIWKPTEKGFDFCLEIGNKFNQLKWRISTIL
jgi:prophage antirepressor-like protein